MLSIPELIYLIKYHFSQTRCDNNDSKVSLGEQKKAVTEKRKVTGPGGGQKAILFKLYFIIQYSKQGQEQRQINH